MKYIIILTMFCAELTGQIAITPKDKALADGVVRIINNEGVPSQEVFIPVGNDCKFYRQEIEDDSTLDKELRGLFLDNLLTPSRIASAYNYIYKSAAISIAEVSGAIKEVNYEEMVLDTTSLPPSPTLTDYLTVVDKAEFQVLKQGIDLPYEITVTENSINTSQSDIGANTWVSSASIPSVISVTGTTNIADVFNGTGIITTNNYWQLEAVELDIKGDVEAFELPTPIPIDGDVRFGLSKAINSIALCDFDTEYSSGLSGVGQTHTSNFWWFATPKGVFLKSIIISPRNNTSIKVTLGCGSYGLTIN